MKPLRVSIIKTEQQDPEHGPCGVLAKNTKIPVDPLSLNPYKMVPGKLPFPMFPGGLRMHSKA